jgi:hypothetical protein
MERCVVAVQRMLCILQRYNGVALLARAPVPSLLQLMYKPLAQLPNVFPPAGIATTKSLTNPTLQHQRG